jgi:hypothetical protein
VQYREAREFAAAAYPDKDLMTYLNGRRALTRLVMNADRLGRLKYRRTDDDQEARGVILLSRSWGKLYESRSLGGSCPAVRSLHELSRREIGDDDARIIANILISQIKGQVVIEDFGFYARRHHAALIREERLIAGVYTLSEFDNELRERSMLMPKEGKRCTFEDAEELAKYAGHRPDLSPQDSDFNRFVAAAMA